MRKAIVTNQSSDRYGLTVEIQEADAQGSSVWIPAIVNRKPGMVSRWFLMWI